MHKKNSQVFHKIPSAVADVGVQPLGEVFFLTELLEGLGHLQAALDPEVLLATVAAPGLHVLLVAVRDVFPHGALQRWVLRYLSLGCPSFSERPPVSPVVVPNGKMRDDLKTELPKELHPM